MIALGIDPSLTACGWAILDSHALPKTRLIEMGVIKSKQKGWERIAEILRVLKEKAMGCDAVAIEGYAFMAQGNSLTGLAELGGIIKFHFWSVQKVPDIYPPSVWRKLILGRGNISKADEGLAMYKQWGLEGDLNSLEAWAVARTHILRTCEATTATKAQKVTLKKLDFPDPNTVT